MNKAVLKKSFKACLEDFEDAVVNEAYEKTDGFWYGSSKEAQDKLENKKKILIEFFNEVLKMSDFEQAVLKEKLTLDKS